MFDTDSPTDICGVGVQGGTIIGMTNGEKIQTILDVDKDCTEVHGENGTMTFTVTQDFWNAEYKEPTTKNNLGVEDCVSRAEVLKLMKDNWHTHNGDWAMQESMDDIRALPSVTPQEPRCKECKWWKDSDGEYRRGCGAESQCPINRKEVFEGNGYCFLFEPQESEEE